MKLDRELEAALRAAKEAGGELSMRSETRSVIREKRPKDYLTEADLASAAVIRGIIREAFPEDGYLSEEDLDSEERLSRRRVWIVDPMDGTREFVEGIPDYVVSIGLVEEGRAVLGVILQPTSGEVYTGVEGEGARKNGEPISVSNAGDPAKARLLVSRSEAGRGELSPVKDLDLHPSGSIAHKLCKVASGEFDAVFTVNPRSEWDIAAGAAILAAAGGEMIRRDGETVTFNLAVPKLPTGLIGSGPALLAPLRDYLASRL